MGRHFRLLEAAAENIIRYGHRTGVLVLCLAVFLIPLLTGLAISEAIKAQAARSVDVGPDLLLSMDYGGRSGPISMDMVDRVKKMDYVKKVVPRVVGRMYYGSKLLIAIGLPEEEIPPFATQIIEGRAFKPGERKVILAGKGYVDYVRGLGREIKPGETVSLTDIRGETWGYQLAGIISSEDVTLWNYDIIVMPLEDAQEYFGLEGMATEIMVNILPGYEVSVLGELRTFGDFFRLQSKSLMRQYIRSGHAERQTIFSLVYVIILVIAIPLISMLSVYGLTERRREVGILKASGWQTSDILELSFFESVILSLLSVAVAFIISILWIKVFNGFVISRLFISHEVFYPPFPVPAVFSFYLVVIALFVSMTITLVGTITSTWKTAVTPPADAMR
ncbi:MAG: FtsX-like permease family protein [Deltaproteobacteria bacterium]|nr:FtsX-like permease family protein [Deltaproteobacteria bacterium]